MKAKKYENLLKRELRRKNPHNPFAMEYNQLSKAHGKLEIYCKEDLADFSKGLKRRWLNMIKGKWTVRGNWQAMGEETERFVNDVIHHLQRKAEEPTWDEKYFGWFKKVKRIKLWFSLLDKGGGAELERQ